MKLITISLLLLISSLLYAQQSGKNLKLTPPPPWFQNADMITSGMQIWKGHKFTVKDTVMTRIMRMRAQNLPMPITEGYPVETIDSLAGSMVKGVSLLSHVPHSKHAYDDAHKKGFRVIPYVHFTDIHSFYADQDVFMFQHPEILLKDERGHWMHIPMDGSDRAFRYLTCANSPSYRRMSLAYVKKMMDWGADGLFVDNVGRRQPCYGPKFSDVNNPEFGPYKHEHMYPDSSHDYAWDTLLGEITKLVKSYGEDKIVILNSGIGTRFQKNGDCCMWESFIYSWAWDGRRHSWGEVKKKAADNEWYTSSGRKITALSTMNPERKEVKDDAFWAFSAARLVGFIWWSELSGTGADILYRAHMGAPMETLKESEGLAYRIFENGIIALNDSDKDQVREITVPKTFKFKSVLDLYNNSAPVKVKSNKLKITVPAKTARVYTGSISL